MSFFKPCRLFNILKFIEMQNNNNKKFVEFLEFVDSGRVKLFKMKDFEEMDKIRRAYGEGVDVTDSVDRFIEKFSK